MHTAASPTQWHGTVHGDRPAYVRYRWGFLGIRVGPPGGDESSAVSGIVIFGEQIGDEWDGAIEWSIVRDIIKPLSLSRILKELEEQKRDA